MEEHAYFTEIFLLLIRQNTIPINAFDHMELSLVINLTKGGNWAIPQPPIFATGNVSFTTAFLILGSNYLLPAKKCLFLTLQIPKTVFII